MGTKASDSNRLVKWQEDAQPRSTWRSGLADALFTSTQQRVMGLLFGQPDRRFYVTELMGLAQSGRGAVQRELKRLEKGGLVVSSMEGNRNYFRANAQSPLYDELCGIVMKTVGLREPLAAALESLRDKISWAFVYGSIASGADRVSSDIDLLIIADDLLLDEIYQALAPAEEAIGRKINSTLYTQKEFAKRRLDDSSFVNRVLDGSYITIVGHDEHPNNEQ